MNVYLFEIKAQFRSFLVWALTILATLLVFMAGVYPVFLGSWDDIQKVLENLPPAFVAASGWEINFLYNYGGFFTLAFSYIALIGAIMAASLALSAFGREKRSRCLDFLFTKPAKRSRLYLAKLLAGVTLLVFVNIIFILATVLLYRGSGQPVPGAGQMLLAASGLFFTQLVFWAAGILYAVAAKRIRSVAGTATVFAFAGFFLSALYNIMEKEALRFITPLKYFDPAAVFLYGGFETRYAVTALALVVLSLILSYLRYCNSDARAA